MVHIALSQPYVGFTIDFWEWQVNNIWNIKLVTKNQQYLSKDLFKKRNVWISNWIFHNFNNWEQVPRMHLVFCMYNNNVVVGTIDKVP